MAAQSPGCAVEVDRRGVERVAQVDDRLGEGAGPSLPAVLGDDGRHPHGEVVDAGLQLHRHLRELRRHPRRVEAHLEQVVLGGQVEVALVGGQLLEPVLHPRQPLVELLRVDGQRHQRPLRAQRRHRRPVVGAGRAAQAEPHRIRRYCRRSGRPRTRQAVAAERERRNIQMPNTATATPAYTQIPAESTARAAGRPKA